MDKDWYEGHDRLDEDQKQILFKELKSFGEYGDAIYSEHNLNEIGKRFAALVEYAERYLNENASDNFDRVTINRNISELKKKVRKFQKEAEKVQQHQERLTALYDDIGMKFNRYFEVGGNEQKSINENMKLTKGKLKGIVKEEISRLLKERRIEYDRQKMLNLMDNDKFIRHVVRDEARDPRNPDDRVLRRAFNSHVLGDSEMERDYKRTDDRRR